MRRSEDWIKYTLDQPMSHEPGEKWVYNGGCLMMLSDILKNAPGDEVVEFVRENRLNPIGMENWSWTIANKNVANTVNGLGRAGFGYGSGARKWGQRKPLIFLDFPREFPVFPVLCSTD